MTRVAFICEHFPFGRAESFIESEISEWAEKGDEIHLTIFPMNAHDERREVPDGIEVKLELSEYLSQKSSERWCRVRGMVSPLFFQELKYLGSEKQLSRKRIVHTLRIVGKFLFNMIALQKVIDPNQFDVVYTYWNSPIAYAATTLTGSNPDLKIVSRLHRVDIYEEFQKYKFMPLKRRFINQFDQLHTISKEAIDYLVSTFDADSSKIRLSRLGVQIPDSPGPVPRGSAMHLLSISNCVAIKRVDKLIEALRLFSETYPDVKIEWTHVGSGPFFEQWKAEAENKLQTESLSFRFVGSKKNAEVHSFLQETPFDLFINASDSEGVPVSIMEAMSYGIPCIAPDVGGIRELLSASCRLLEAQFSPETLSQSIFGFVNESRKPEIRRECRNFIIAHYNNKKNHANFIGSIQECMK